jgi:RNA polymerase sigma-70 factor (ECF subfamily)
MAGESVGAGRGVDALRELGDDALAALAAGGDRLAFELIFARYRLLVLRICVRVSGNVAVGEDLLQETFLRVWLALPRRGRDTGVKGWICAVARNAALDARPRSPDAVLELGDGVASSLDTAADAVLDLRARDALGDIAALPERQRRVVALRELPGMSYAAIGATLGISGTAAKRAAEVGRENLKLAAAARERGCADVRAILAVRKRGRFPRWVYLHAGSCPSCGALLRERTGAAAVC